MFGNGPLPAIARGLVAEAIIHSTEEERIKATEKEQERERGLHLNGGLSVEQPCYEVARWRGTKMQRLGGLAFGCWWELGDRIRVRKKGTCRKNLRKK